MFDNEQEWKEKFDEAVKAQQENKYDYAEHTWMVAVEEAEALGPNDQRLALTLDRLCEFLLLRGKLQEAASYGYRALAIYEEALGENADELASILANLAMLAKTNNNKIEAPWLSIQGYLAPANPGLKPCSTSSPWCSNLWAEKTKRISSGAFARKTAAPASEASLLSEPGSPPVPRKKFRALLKR
ncbi:MAG TPA: tetratricopeptide repeat protein [Candidatus Melainabacteria bacterium]|nr:tetratricopeptide repeat protein [Candidatus Melainabacteria bacterium]